MDKQTLYTTKPYAYALLFGISERGAQKAFERGYIDGDRVEADFLKEYAGSLIYERAPNHIRMLTPYFEELERRHTKANKANNPQTA